MIQLSRCWLPEHTPDTPDYCTAKNTKEPKQTINQWKSKQAIYSELSHANLLTIDHDHVVTKNTKQTKANQTKPTQPTLLFSPRTSGSAVRDTDAVSPAYPVPCSVQLKRTSKRPYPRYPYPYLYPYLYPYPYPYPYPYSVTYTDPLPLTRNHNPCHNPHFLSPNL